MNSRLIKILDPNFKFDDDRGSLVQLVREGYSQFNIIFSKKDVLRGNHYHKYNKEAFYVINGKLKLTVSKDDVVEEHIFSKGDMFEVEPYVNHSFFYLEDTLLASMYSDGVELSDGTKDIWSDK